MERPTPAATADDRSALLDELMARLDAQQAEIEQLRAALAGSTCRPSAGSVGAGTGRLERRRALARVATAVLAAGALAASREPATAEAAARTNLLSGVTSSPNFGLAATDGLTDDPLLYIPDISGQAYGVIGTRGGPGFRPPISAGVLGSGFQSGGVVGISASEVGVYGASATGIGVFGSSGSTVGMFGYSNTAAAVYGLSEYSVGVYGAATRNAGVYGSSPVYGVWGQSGDGWGVYGESTRAGIGVRGKCPAPGWAGFFEGNVYVTGRLFQGGSSTPSAGPEAATAEDFGRARLVNGRAVVPLDPAFVAESEGGDYHVFLTDRGDSLGLFVSSSGPDRFVVQEKRGGTGNHAFDYRIVARKRNATRRGPRDGRSQDGAPERVAAPAEASAPKDVAPPRAPERPAGSSGQARR
jgi:hypothetical protein